MACTINRRETLHFAAGAPLQARIVDQAKGAPNLASTLNIGAFNLGNAGGAIFTAPQSLLRTPAKPWFPFDQASEDAQNQPRTPEVKVRTIPGMVAPRGDWSPPASGSYR